MKLKVVRVSDPGAGVLSEELKYFNISSRQD
jgi:hypothetical protein